MDLSVASHRFQQCELLRQTTNTVAWVDVHRPKKAVQYLVTERSGSRHPCLDLQNFTTAEDHLTHAFPIALVDEVKQQR